MSRRTGFGRHGDAIDDASGDPLDGLVNLFDIGIVLAIAFLVAGLGLTVDARSGRIRSRATTPAAASRGQPQQRRVPQRRLGGTASGRGAPLGTLYRLADGTLVVVGANGATRPAPPSRP